jgi:molybdopterin-containing oxidoreductase family iron-sulfur binding subunit
MKRILQHPEPTHAEQTGPQYWRSLDAVADTPGFRKWLEQEFPQGASQLDAAGQGRRHFLKIMAAGFGLAGLGLSGCSFRSPKQYILPYTEQPEYTVPGVATYYASSRPHSWGNIPVVVETHQNRPTKVEGNPSYRPFGGGTDSITQASILDLYDPDRATEHRDMQQQAPLSQEAVDQMLDNLATRFAQQGGKGLAFLAPSSTSPTQERLQKLIKERYPQALWFVHDALEQRSTQIALHSVYGQPVRLAYHFEKAKRVVSIDADFLHTEPNHLAYMRDFVQQRKVHSPEQAHQMNRLYALESAYTLTGGMADHRLRVHGHDLEMLTLGLTQCVAKSLGKTVPQSLLPHAAPSSTLSEHAAWLQACADDLALHCQGALVVAGRHTSPRLQSLVAYLNTLLDAPGHTLSVLTLPTPLHDGYLADLAQAVQNQWVQTLFILEGNPAYDAPGGLDWPNLQKSIPQVIRLGYWLDETSALSHVHIATGHYLETWSDGRTWDGTWVPVQPVILPLYATSCVSEVLGRLLGLGQQDAYTWVRQTFEQNWGSQNWERFLAEGTLASTSYPISQAQFNIQGLEKLWQHRPAAHKPCSAQCLEVRVSPSPQVWDGSFSNNGWLQELPDPMTKLCWDNAILISPHLAQELQALTGKPLLRKPSLMNAKGQLQSTLNDFEASMEKAWVARLQVEGRHIEGPLHILPGLADYTVWVQTGYGRTHTGRVGQGCGFSVYPLLQPDGAGYLQGATLHLSERQVFLANTQEHGSMEGRAILREANAQDFAQHPDCVKHMCVESHSPPIYGSDQDMPLAQKATAIPRGTGAYQTPAFKGLQQWGMVIDLNSCTGCSACTIACQSENNIPIVGKDQVLRGREMHWIRLDRYFATGKTQAGQLPKDPQVSFMAMMCQHCELAPCETVCPVAATVHDEEGLNVMAYNRCVGTRYCANNCPYKVRRFNFFDFNKRSKDHLYAGPFGPKGMPETLKMQKNPDVTLRMRGVMEKCTYCVQRIEEAKILRRNKVKDSADVRVPDGAILTACQQVCPTQAITFGDIADPQSRVSQLKASARDYSVLGYLNTRPRTTYLARLRNPNSKMPDYASHPLSRMEYEARYGHASH